MIEAAGYYRVTMIRENANDVLLKNTLPEELKHSSLVSRYKGKGNLLSTLLVASTNWNMVSRLLRCY